MTLLKEVGAEFIGMFVGDPRLAVAVLALIALTAALVGLVHSGGLIGGAVLLFGCLAILVESVRHGAKSP
ncbi:MAG TPA: hypothetical protein VM782_05415 [Stellaceae bacterium]|nr:hypothetical protein [Stellaceae bacterium]